MYKCKSFGAYDRFHKRIFVRIIFAPRDAFPIYLATAESPQKTARSLFRIYLVLFVVALKTENTFSIASK